VSGVVGVSGVAGASGVAGVPGVAGVLEVLDSSDSSGTFGCEMGGGSSPEPSIGCSQETSNRLLAKATHIRFTQENPIWVKRRTCFFVIKNSSFCRDRGTQVPPLISYTVPDLL
jgi:hypothetical protein